MKCLKCGKNSLYRERSGGKCSGCGQSFVFEPKSGDPFTDTGFHKAIENVSHRNSLSYQPRQLFYEAARLRLKRPGVRASKLGAVIGTGFLGFILGIPWTILWLEAAKVGAAIVMIDGLWLLFWLLIMLIVWHRTDPFKLTLDSRLFAKCLHKWQASQGALTGLMLRPPALPPAPREKDLHDYTVERAIICDHQEVVDFLLANNFHVEQKCALLTYGGYPSDRFDAIRAMLRRNPQLHVFALHNASANGCRLFHSLTHSKEWFPGSKRVFDVGLHPRHANAFKGLWTRLPQKHRLEPIPGYSADEIKWLETYKLELMAVRPDHLLNRLRNVINGHARSLSEAYASGDSSGDAGGPDLIAVGHFDAGGDDDFG